MEIPIYPKSGFMRRGKDKGATSCFLLSPFSAAGNSSMHCTAITHQREGDFNQTGAPLWAELHWIRRTYCSTTHPSAMGTAVLAKAH